MNALERTAASCECPDCLDRSRLAVRWNGRADEVWCPVCGRTDGFVKRESLTARWKRSPESVPVQIANRFAAKYGAEIEAAAEGLPAELANVVREKYGLPTKKGE